MNTNVPDCDPSKLQEFHRHYRERQQQKPSFQQPIESCIQHELDSIIIEEEEEVPIQYTDDDVKEDEEEEEQQQQQDIESPKGQEEAKWKQMIETYRPRVRPLEQYSKNT